MKRVIMLRSNPIDPDPRVEKEALALIRNGISVFILCWNRSDNSGCRESVLKIGDKSVKIVKIGCKASFGEGVKNLIPFVKFQILMGLYLLKKRECYDIIHACDFDTAFISSIISRILGKKFVFDIFDFIFGRPKNLFQKVIKKLQYVIINHADATIICTEKRKQQIRGTHPKKLIVIHNTPERKILNITSDHSSGKVKFVYVGILQDYRLINEILVCMSEHPEVELHIGGFGKYEDLLKLFSRKYNNIIFYGKLPYDKTLELEYMSDVMLAIYDPSIENHEYAAPNKFYEGLMLGKPLIMVKGTGMSEVVETYDIGCLIEYSKRGFENGIYDILSKRDRWESMSLTMKKIYDQQFAWKIMEKRLAELYCSL